MVREKVAEDVIQLWQYVIGVMFSQGKLVKIAEQ